MLSCWSRLVSFAGQSPKVCMYCIKTVEPSFGMVNFNKWIAGDCEVRWTCPHCRKLNSTSIDREVGLSLVSKEDDRL